MSRDNETLPRTRKAVKAWDADEKRRAAYWAAADTNSAVYAAEAADKAAADKVREAFAEDTREINTRDRAFLVSPDSPWLRENLRRTV